MYMFIHLTFPDAEYENIKKLQGNKIIKYR